MKLLRSVPTTDDFLQIPVPAGKYRGFAIRVTGTNNTGYTVDWDSLGTIKLIVNNKDQQYADLYDLDRIVDYKWGVADSESVDAGAINLITYLPQHMPKDEINVLHVESDGEAVLELDGFSDTTDISNGTLEVYAIEREGIQSYGLKITQADYDAVNGTGVQDLKGVENVAEIFIKNDTSNLDRLNVIVDGETTVRASRDAIEEFTNIFNEIETYAAQPFLDIQLMQTGQVSEALNDSIQLETTMSSSATLEVMIFAIDFAPEKELSSSATLESKVSSKIQKKKTAGKTRPARSLAR